MEKRETYIVTVIGCDDATRAAFILTKEEFKLVKRVARAITNASTYRCMPTMHVEKAGK